jgi:hypothetical protein
MDHALGHRQGAIPDVNGQQQFTLGVHRHPHPVRAPLQTLDGLRLADLTVLDRTEQGEEFVQLHLLDAHVVQEVLGEGPQLRGRLHEPLQDRVGVDLEHPRRAPDAQALRQARDDPHDEVDGGALPMKDRPEALQEVAATGDAQQLAPATATGMAVGADIPPSRPAPIGTVRVRAKVRRGVDLAAAPARHDDAWWRG